MAACVAPLLVISGAKIIFLRGSFALCPLVFPALKWNNNNKSANSSLRVPFAVPQLCSRADRMSSSVATARVSTAPSSATKSTTAPTTATKPAASTVSATLLHAGRRPSWPPCPEGSGRFGLSRRKQKSGDSSPLTCPKENSPRISWKAARMLFFFYWVYLIRDSAH